MSRTFAAVTLIRTTSSSGDKIDISYTTFFSCSQREKKPKLDKSEDLRGHETLPRPPAANPFIRKGSIQVFSYIPGKMSWYSVVLEPHDASNIFWYMLEKIRQHLLEEAHLGNLIRYTAQLMIVNHFCLHIHEKSLLYSTRTCIMWIYCGPYTIFVHIKYTITNK